MTEKPKSTTDRNKHIFLGALSMENTYRSNGIITKFSGSFAKISTCYVIGQ